jgi:hypothetical protein
MRRGSSSIAKAEDPPGATLCHRVLGGGTVERATMDFEWAIAEGRSTVPACPMRHTSERGTVR